MFMTRIHATGLAMPVELDSVTRTADVAVGAQATAAADALSLWKAALVGSKAQAALHGLGLQAQLADPVEGEAPRYDLWRVAPSGVNRLLDPDVQDIQIDVSIHPDPPLYGRLREHAKRDPRLVTALGQQAEMHVKVGWRFTHDRTFATSDLLGVRIGEVSFPMTGKERPAWLPAFLGDVAARVFRLDLEDDWAHTIALLHEAALSSRPERRETWTRLVHVLASPPFGLEGFTVTVDGPHSDIATGASMRSARHLDRGQRDGIRLAAAALLIAPDVLIAPYLLPENLRAWLDTCTQGDDATLEQVIRATVEVPS